MIADEWLEACLTAAQEEQHLSHRVERLVAEVRNLQKQNECLNG